MPIVTCALLTFLITAILRLPLQRRICASWCITLFVIARYSIYWPGHGDYAFANIRKRIRRSTEVGILVSTHHSRRDAKSGCNGERLNWVLGSSNRIDAGSSEIGQELEWILSRCGRVNRRPRPFGQSARGGDSHLRAEDRAPAIPRTWRQPTH